MAGVDGWQIYGPPPDRLATNALAGALEAYVHDCRLFARLAREAKLAELPKSLNLTWEEFCEQRLLQPLAIVDAVIAGVEVLGEELPIPADVARRVGDFVLGKPGGQLGNRNAAKDSPKNERSETTFVLGRGAAYLLARLDRDHPELAARVRSGELKPYPAAKLAGIIKPPSETRCVMQGLLWWIPRWRASSAYMEFTLEEQGAYRNILDEMTLRNGVIPNDESTLAKACGDPRKWKKIREKVLKRFTLTEKGWSHETLSEVLQATEKRISKQQKWRSQTGLKAGLKSGDLDLGSGSRKNGTS